MCHKSSVMCHLSNVTCHVSDFFFFFSFFGQNGWAIQGRVCNQRGLPRLVFFLFGLYCESGYIHLKAVLWVKCWCRVGPFITYQRHSWSTFGQNQIPAWTRGRGFLYLSSSVLGSKGESKPPTQLQKVWQSPQSNLSLQHRGSQLQKSHAQSS